MSVNMHKPRIQSLSRLGIRDETDEMRDEINEIRRVETENDTTHQRTPHTTKKHHTHHKKTPYTPHAKMEREIEDEGRGG